MANDFQNMPPRWGLKLFGFCFYQDGIVRNRRSGVSAERRILLLLFSDGGFLPKAATRRNSRSVWTAATSAPLFVRTVIIHLSKPFARPKAPGDWRTPGRFA
jgi:hypothetical protein